MELVLPLPLPRWLVRLVAFMNASRPPSVGDVDPAIVARARRGDHHAFRVIVHHYDERLRRLAYRLLGDRTLMDDVLQEAYVKAFRSIERFKGDSALGTWLYRIVYNACVDQLRSQRETVALDETTAATDAHSDPADIAATRRDLAAALAALPADQRAAVLLVDADGMDYTQAAAVLGVAEGTVGSRLTRARVALRAALELR